MADFVWEKLTEKEIKEVDKFCNKYKEFLTNSKTERETIVNSIKIAEKNGFISLETKIKNGQALKPGDKVYVQNKDKALILAVIGTDSFESGFNIIGAHVDSPRLDLKSNPVYENSNLCLLDTHYYGGIKKYHWVAQPLAIHGIVCKKDGTKFNVVLGEKEDDFVFCITDLLPHLTKDKQVIEGENLDVLCANMPSKNVKENKIKNKVFEILKSYNIDEQDFISAELELVPSGKARDMGLDKSMILAYGQDDRSCVYTSLRALCNTKTPTKTSICLLVDKEEIGSEGATSMKSKFFENIIAEIMNLKKDYTELKLRRALTNSNVLSADVTAGFDPNYPTPSNKNTDAYLGHGVSFNKYTGSKGKIMANDANPEYIAKLRNILDSDKVYYQFTEMGKVDAGGGGTIAYILANYGMNVIDAGVPLLNMHAPWEISSKVDIYEAYKCYLSFFKSNINV